MYRKFWMAPVVAVITLLFEAQPVTAAQRVMNGHVPEAVKSLAAMGQVPTTNRLTLAIGLPLRNEAGLDTLLGEIYDPASPKYHHYLTPQEFTASFGPSEEDYQAVINFAQTNGLQIVGTHRNRVVLDVSGSTADINRAFHVTLKRYRHPQEARDFFAPDTEPVTDAALKIMHVSGLDNYAVRRPKFVKSEAATPNAKVVPHSGSGNNSSYIGNDFRAAYVPGTTLDGTGQSVALLEFDGYVSNDIVAYENLAGLPRMSLTNVAIGSGVSPPGGGNLEVCLDIDMVIAMAPGVSKIIVYEATNTVAWQTILSKMANDNSARQISCSWGDNSPGSVDTVSEGIFKQMASQGQTFFNASGDADAFVGGIPFPSESTNIIQVGGTTLSMNGLGASYASETAWNRGLSHGQYAGTSGGISAHFAIPPWQQGISMVMNLGSPTFHNVPDVAMTAENVFVISDTNQSTTVGGTSCAAPLWAGFMALVNQQATAYGQPAAGFINPAIYAIGKGTNYNACFHDTTTGNNFWNKSPTKFPAEAGYDLCTGWGTPNGINLINALAPSMDNFTVLPAGGFTATGVPGGPFTPIAQTFILTNTGISTMNWTATNSAAWVNLSATHGTLAPSASVSVDVTLNTNAVNAFFTGTYAANVIFSNTASHIGQIRQFSVVVQPPLIFTNGGFETGDFTGWTLTGDVTYVGVVNAYAHSGNYGAALGPLGSLSFLSQAVPTLPGQSYLVSFWLTNSVAGTVGEPNQFQMSWNGGTIFNQTNLGILAWTNLQYVVAATSTNTVLQFGFRNDPVYFGLDDVTVTYVPVPSLIPLLKKASSFSFTWNTIPGIAYQVQYQTNLLNTNWLVLSNITAAAGVTTFTNVTGSDPRRFYRIRRLP